MDKLAPIPDLPLVAILRGITPAEALPVGQAVQAAPVRPLAGRTPEDPALRAAEARLWSAIRDDAAAAANEHSVSVRARAIWRAFMVFSRWRSRNRSASWGALSARDA